MQSLTTKQKMKLLLENGEACFACGHTIPKTVTKSIQTDPKAAEDLQSTTQGVSSDSQKKKKSGKFQTFGSRAGFKFGNSNLASIQNCAWKGSSGSGELKFKEDEEMDNGVKTAHFPSLKSGEVKRGVVIVKRGDIVRKDERQGNFGKGGKVKLPAIVVHYFSLNNEEAGKNKMGMNNTIQVLSEETESKIVVPLEFEESYNPDSSPEVSEANKSAKRGKLFIPLQQDSNRLETLTISKAEEKSVVSPNFGDQSSIMPSHRLRRGFKENLNISSVPKFGTKIYIPENEINESRGSLKTMKSSNLAAGLRSAKNSNDSWKKFEDLMPNFDQKNEGKNLDKKHKEDSEEFVGIDPFTSSSDDMFEGHLKQSPRKRKKTRMEMRVINLKFKQKMLNKTPKSIHSKKKLGLKRMGTYEKNNQLKLRKINKLKAKVQTPQNRIFGQKM